MTTLSIGFSVNKLFFSVDKIVFVQFTSTQKVFTETILIKNKSINQIGSENCYVFKLKTMAAKSILTQSIQNCLSLSI